MGPRKGGLIDLGPRQNFADLAKKVDDISDLAKYFPKFLDLANNHQKTYPQIFIALGTPEAIKIALQETNFEFSLKADVLFYISIWDKTDFFLTIANEICFKWTKLRILNLVPNFSKTERVGNTDK